MFVVKITHIIEGGEMESFECHKFGFEDKKLVLKYAHNKASEFTKSINVPEFAFSDVGNYYRAEVGNYCFWIEVKETKMDMITDVVYENHYTTIMNS